MNVERHHRRACRLEIRAIGPLGEGVAGNGTEIGVEIAVPSQWCMREIRAEM